MTIRQQGKHFSMPRHKIIAVSLRSGLHTTAVVEFALDYDWPNAADHQAWLDEATPDQITQWLWEVTDAYAMTQEMPVMIGHER
jgi:hypothetical protein